MKKIAIVTGGSGGIGIFIAAHLFKKGCAVYEFSRSGKSTEHATHIDCDVTSEQAVAVAVQEVVSREGKIDILVNNAGFGISGAVEFTPPKESQKQLQVNLFGMDNVTRAVLPFMRNAKSGRIVCVSSVAAVMPIPFQTWYTVSKAAINAYTMALANEVRPFGISVAAVMPGDIKTGFTAARKKAALGNEEYNGRIDRSVARMERDEQNGMNPEYAGRFIAKFALKKRSAPLAVIGVQYKFLCFLGKILPASLVQRVLYILYAR